MDLLLTLEKIILLSVITTGFVEVWKGVVSDKDTQKLSIIVATFLSFITKTFILVSLDFSPANYLVSKINQLQYVYNTVFWFTDLIITGFICSKGSNFIADIFKLSKK